MASLTAADGVHPQQYVDNTTQHTTRYRSGGRSVHLSGAMYKSVVTGGAGGVCMSDV